MMLLSGPLPPHILLTHTRTNKFNGLHHVKAQVVLHFNFVSQETPCCGIALNTNKHLANELTKQ